MSKPWNRRQFLSAAAGGLLGACLANPRRAGAIPTRTPNLVIVFPDQMRGQALGFMDEDPVLTPNLDRFAQESLVLTRAVSNYPVCSPFRAMLMTGRYPHTNGVLSNCNSNSAPHDCELRKTDRCWSDVLKDRGYSLGYIGKWHLDAPYKPYVDCENNRGATAWNEWCPPDRRHGFDFWYAYGTYDYHLTPMYWPTNATRHTPVKVSQWGPEHEADLAIEYLRNTDGQYRDADRYAGQTATYLINRPNVNLTENTSGAKLAKKHIKNYFAMVTGVDDQFGRILAALKEDGLEKDTIVLFTSDHGNCLGCHEKPTKNVHYEESMRVPFLVRWPERIKPRHDDLLISTPDIYPTLLDLLGLASDIPTEVQGASHASLFTVGRGHRPTSQLYMWAPVGQPAWGRRGIRTARYTFVVSKSQGKPIERILHDNLDDPYQLKNIAARHPDVVRQSTEELEQRLEANNDPWLQS